MLPGYMRAENGATISVGGLESSRFDVKRVTWSQINTLSMTASIGVQSMLVDSNLPELGGARIAVDRFRRDIVDGLRRTLRLVAENKPTVRPILEALRGANVLVRRVVRPTRFYYLLLRRMSDHRTMTDGVTWSLQSELITRLYDLQETTTQPWKLFRQERSDLCRMTVPAFYLASDRTVARSWEGPVTNLHAQNGLDVALERLQSLDDTEIEYQCAFANAALGERSDVSPAFLRRAGKSENLVDDIVAHLRERAIVEGQSAAWLGLEYVDHRLMSQVVPIGHDLYNGALGIALFLAAAASTRQDTNAYELARRAVAPVKGILLSDGRHRLARAVGTGGYLGLGSLVYGLATYWSLSGGDQDALESAAAAAALIDPSTIAKDKRHDLVSGSAGAVLGLLKLHRVTGDRSFLATAISIGEQMLKVKRAETGMWTSADFEGCPLTGISHGASGLSLAFAALADSSGDTRFLATANDCLEFERSCFEPGKNNWRDTRPERMRRSSESPNQWCYGATGIGYARLGMLEMPAFSGNPDLADDLGHAIRSVLSIGEHSNDTLCCGIAGHADFLVAASASLNQPQLHTAAANRIESIQQRWCKTGDVRWDQGDKNFNLGLMRGLAGVGYAALRSENPQLPRLLILE